MKLYGTFVLTGREPVEPAPAPAPAVTSLLVLRHAPTEWNEQRRLQSRTDTPLSTAGRVMAVAWRLPEGARKLRWDVGPSRRTMETAQQIGVTPHAEPRLAEMDWGEWEGRTLADLRASGDLTPAMEAEGIDLRPPGGESLRDVQRRLADWLKEVAARRAATGAITHNGVLRALYALATGWDVTTKAPVRLLAGHAHRFSVADGGAPTVVDLNIPLAAPHP